MKKKKKIIKWVVCLKWPRENFGLRNPSLMLSNVPVLGQAWFPPPGKMHQEWQDLHFVLKNFQVGNAPQVSLGMQLSAQPALVCVNINSECNVWISAGSRWEISTSPGSHQCSLLPAPKELPPQKKVEFFCANTQYHCEMNPLYFYFLSLSRFFSPLKDVLFLYMKWGLHKTEFLFRFFWKLQLQERLQWWLGSYTKRVLLPFLLETTSSPCSEVFFLFFFQSLLSTRDVANTEPAKFRFYCAVFRGVTREREHSLCPSVPVPGCFSLGIKIFEFLRSCGQTLQARGGSFII